MGRWRTILSAAGCAGVVAGLAGQAGPTSGAPPHYVVAEATIEPLARPMAGGNTVLRVRFSKGTRPPARIPYAIEGGTVVLADDGTGVDARAGDGVYTALGSLDLVAFRDRLVRLSRSQTAMPLRTYRTRAKVETAARLDPSQFTAGQQFQYEPWGDPAAISTSRSLLVRHLNVVEDATRTRASCGQASMGVWSFGYLMEQMANTPVTGITAAQFTRQWLDTWMTDQVVNGWTVKKRTLMQEKILDGWIAASGGPGLPLDLSRAPFKLLAIVNRIDLRHQGAYGGSSGGELRFVFEVVPEDTCLPGRAFQVILEFGVPASGCVHQHAYAQQWKNLDTLLLGSPAYNAALEAITQQVVVAGAGMGKANGSALNQLRVNSNLLDDTGDGLDWELRQFVIDPVSHHLKMSTISQTPDKTLRGSGRVAQYVNANEAAVLADDYVVPLAYPSTQKFRAGGFYAYGSAWPVTGITSPEARHRFALNTCDGCHTKETDTVFSHVKRAPFGATAQLSGFMTGIWASDGEHLTPDHYFDDLERRALDLETFLGASCFTAPLDLPLFASH